MSDLKAVSTSDQLRQLDWVEKAKYYEYTNISDYLENHKPKESSYGMFIPPSDDLNVWVNSELAIIFFLSILF